MHRRRPARRLLWLLVVVSLGYVALCGGQVAWAAVRDDEAALGRVTSAPDSAIVVLGAAQYNGRPSPIYQARLDHTFALWRDGVANLIVVTGGGQHPGCREFDCSEARAGAEYLYSLGVPGDAVAWEVDSRNTYQSLSAVRLILENRGIADAVLVSDPTHALRSREIATEVGIDAVVSSTRSSPMSTGTALRQGARETVAVALGRLLSYRDLSRMSRVFS